MNNDQDSQIINWQLGSICCRVLRLGSSVLASAQRLPDDAALAPHSTPDRQQTSSGGEKYSGLASNLAHLGRIC